MLEVIDYLFIDKYMPKIGLKISFYRYLVNGFLRSLRFLD